jgi:hypothetical protein
MCNRRVHWSSLALGGVLVCIFFRLSLPEKGQLCDPLSHQLKHASPVTNVAHRRMPPCEIVVAHSFNRWHQLGRINPSPRPDRWFFWLRRPIEHSLAMLADQTSDKQRHDDQSDDDFCD